MSEELEWELFEIFENALFAFPIYDHKSARAIVNYLLRRGVLEEEIAEAIEDTTIDLMIWLNRGGKHMVGEWVISWVNETREEYLREVEIERLHLEEMARDVTPGRSIATSESGDTEDFNGSQSQLSKQDEVISEPNNKTLQGENIAETEKEPQVAIIEDTVSAVGSADSGVLDNSDDNDDDDNDEDESASPLLSPPRTLRRKWSKKGRQPPTTPHPDPELDEDPETTIINDKDSKFDDKESTVTIDVESTIDQDSNLDRESTSMNNEEVCGVEVVARHHSPTTSDTEEGATGSSSPSTFYSSIPSDDLAISEVDQALETLVTPPDYNQNRKCTNCTLANKDVFQVDKNGLPVKSQCTCTLAHYSYITQLKQAEANNQDYCDYYSEMSDRALEINVDTLDKDGPGFIFIMTDSLRECMPWSAESRYKVASSRKPERCLLEFRSRNVDIDLIWQVKVEHHLMAVKEVHTTLVKYTLLNNWFRCSLSEIMEAISKVIKKYKHK